MCGNTDSVTSGTGAPAGGSAFLKDVGAVIFDMGGTLIEFERLPWSLMQIVEVNELYAFLSKRNGTVPSLKVFSDAYGELWKEARDNSISNRKELDLGVLLGSVCSRVGIETNDQLVRALVETHYAPVRRELTVYPDVTETLKTLQTRGYKLALLSNTMWPREFHEADLDRFGLDEFFKVRFFSSDFPCRKPHPGIFLAAAEALDVPAENAVYVGDFPERDIVGAQAAGMKGILKYHPLRKIPSSIVADISIRCIADLLNLLA